MMNKADKYAKKLTDDALQRGEEAKRVAESGGDDSYAQRLTEKSLRKADEAHREAKK